MSLSLCIDWGNTLVKAALFQPGGTIVESRQFAASEALASLHDLIARFKPESAILCSVVTHPPDVEAMLAGQVSYFHVLGTNSRLPIMNAYLSPDTLGADRLALVAGAHALYPGTNVLVVSLGTCITYNLLLQNKAFRGGAISPGLRMRLQAMHEFTDKLPLVSPEGSLMLMGYDTETSIRSGAINGMAAEIDGMVQAYAAQYPDFNAVLTGGDAAFFGNKLKSKIFAHPDLLLTGLFQILNHNVPQIR